MLLPSTTYQSTTTESVNVNEAPSRRFYCAAASFSSAGLIHEVAGSSGGSGGLRTNRFSRAVAGAAARARQQLAGVDLAVDLTKARVADLHPDVLVRIAVHETHRAGDEGHATLGERLLLSGAQGTSSRRRPWSALRNLRSDAEGSITVSHRPVFARCASPRVYCGASMWRTAGGHRP